MNKRMFAQGMRKFADGTMGFSASFGIGEVIIQNVQHHPVMSEAVGVVSTALFVTAYVMHKTTKKLEEEVEGNKRLRR